MAACIAAEHKKWDERPLLVVVKKPGAELTRDELIAFYEGRIAKWWTPDDVVFVDAIPLGATGKMLKNRLREQYGKRLVESPDRPPRPRAAPASGRRPLAFCWWGFFPIYFRLLPGVHPVEVLANRIVWALLLVTAVLAWRATGRGSARRCASEDAAASFVASALLLSANWITYIWAVSNGHVVDSSLGYFITPLVNVALGYGCSASGRGGRSGSPRRSPRPASSG
jgi:hypothetical protein